MNQVYRFVDQNIRQQKLKEEEMVSAIIAVLLTRRLNLQLNEDTANLTLFIQKYDVRLIRIGFFQCLFAVQLVRVLRLKSRIEWTIKQKCHLIFMSSFQFTNRTFWILNVDKCWNIFSEKKMEILIALCQLNL
jgi:hypothetical protein